MEVTSSAAKPGGPSSAWPVNDLERVAACPICGAVDSPILHADLVDLIGPAPGLWTLRGCLACTCAYLDPRPSAASIGQAYASYATHEPPPASDDVGRRLPARVRRALRNGYLADRHGLALSPRWAVGARVLPAVPGAARRATRHVRHMMSPKPAARLLDVGCGNGAFLVEMRAAGWSVQGLEPDPVAAAQGREAGISVEEGTLEIGTFPPESFDMVTLNHVLEHVPDPVATLRACREVLRPAGWCWVATPNLKSEGHHMYGRNWRGLEPPRHLVLFTPEALRRTFDAAGFQLTRRLPVAADGSHMFAASEQIAAAAGAPTGRSARGARLAAARADLRAWRDPDRAEEVVMVAEP